MAFVPEWEGQVCSLGYDLIDWLEAYACHGPGDLQGDPLVFDNEMAGFIVECYRLDEETGRRVFDEAVLSRPKGRAKSEIAGLIATAEAFGPVRFDGFDANGQPIGKRVRSPMIKCLATEESQAGNTFENVAFIAGEWGPDAHPEIFGGAGGVRRYQSATAVYVPGGGEIRACTSGSASKDGGKETFVVPDETHLYVLPELKAMYATVKRNLPKRRIAEPWALQTTTAYRPGEQSIAEETLTAWRKGTLSMRVLVDHREAQGKIDLDDKEHTLEQLRYVYGDAADWTDFEYIYTQMRDPRVCPDVATAARYYFNRAMATKDAWIDTDVVEFQSVLAPEDARPRPEPVADAEEWIALGFDGSLNDDSTVLIASRMSDGFVFPIDIWEKPDGPEAQGWEVDRPAVLATIRETFFRYNVTRLYMDPHEWRSDLDQLAEEYPGRVFAWETRRDIQMAAALDRLHTGMKTGEVWHSGDSRMVEHFGNAYVRRKAGHRLVRKEYAGSPRKIDSVIGAALAGEARADAIAAAPIDTGPRRAKGKNRYR